MALLATSALAACSSGSTGMLPINPRPQSLPHTPTRAIGSAPSGMGMHATVHTPNGSNLLVGGNPATGENPTGPIGRAHTDAVSAPPPPCDWLNYGAQGSCQPSQGGGSGGGTFNPGGGGTGGCSSNVECGQPCYEGGSGCTSPTQVACNGTASQCQGRPCSGSPETISDFFRPAGSNASIQVTDINSIWQNGAEVGWIYLGNNGVRYYQANYSTKAGVKFGISIGFASASIQPGTYSNIEQWTGSLPSGSGVQKCESEGQQLV